MQERTGAFSDMRQAGPSLCAERPKWRRKGTVYVLGLDALTLDVIGPLIERGELPNFQRLAEEGCWGRMPTIRPNNSAVIWTTITTGLNYRKHGIDAHQYYRLFGRRISRPMVRKINSLGLKVALRPLMWTNLMREHQMDYTQLRARRVWDIVSDLGGSVCVVNFYQTWPAYPVNGILVTDRLNSRRHEEMGINYESGASLSYPNELMKELSPLIVSPSQVPLDWLAGYVDLPENELRELRTCKWKKRDIRSELRFAVSSDLTTWQVFRHCLDSSPPFHLAVSLWRGIDNLQHTALRYVPFMNDPAVTEEERRKFGEIVPQAYRFADQIIGDILARMGPADTLFVVSDHGCAYEPKRGAYGHKRSLAPGVFYAYGKEFRQGFHMNTPTVFDVTPTILRVLGLPPAHNMDGRCLQEALTPQFLAEHPPLEPIETYGPPQPYRIEEE